MTALFERKLREYEEGHNGTGTQNIADVSLSRHRRTSYAGTGENGDAPYRADEGRAGRGGQRVAQRTMSTPSVIGAPSRLLRHRVIVVLYMYYSLYVL